MGLVRRVAHHDPLIACAHVLRANSSGDIGRLLMETNLQLEHALGIAAQIPHAAADAVDGICRDFAAIYLSLGGHLAADDHLAFREHDLNGNTGRWILRKVCVQNGIGDLIAELVRMTGTDGFRRNQSKVLLVHCVSPCFSRNG